MSAPSHSGAAGDQAAASDAASTPTQHGSVVSVNVAAAKGMRKAPQAEIRLVAGHGVEGDGHAGPWHRQVSLLARESIATMRAKGLDVGPGDFAENVTTEGVAVAELPLGTRLRLGGCLVELTQIGKVCHDHCAIYRAAGDCVMPREGIFVRVLRGGPLRAGDEVVVESLGDGSVEGVADGVADGDGLIDATDASGDDAHDASNAPGDDARRSPAVE
jgi:MOSC domain-containing protein YiiM